ncbi:MAG TPA: type II toxin-antitoxin system HicB family antitoxin [Candidatus Paceibacterota bacterium]
MAKLVQEEKKEIERLASLFPQKLTVTVTRSEDGGFVAQLIDFPRCYTQGDHFTELMANINDAIYTYFEIPEEYRVHMPEYSASMQIAEFCGLLPKVKSKTDLTLESFREAVNS